MSRFGSLELVCAGARLRTIDPAWEVGVPADPFRSALQSLADLGEPDGDEAVWLPSLVQGALQALPRFDHASITIRRNGNPLDTIATTDDIAVQGDRLQGELREGPCHDAATDADYKFSRVLRDDPTWPRYGPKVAELGMVSQLALHLNMRRGPRASLNLYADRLVEIDDPVLEMAGLYAASMSNILGLVRTVDNLRTALGTNRTIGQAIGIVMERHQMSQERAFAYLSRLSQDSNIKLVTIAEQLVSETTPSGDSVADPHVLYT